MVTDVRSLKETVDEILQTYDGFKLLQYQLGEDLLEYLILDAGLEAALVRRAAAASSNSYRPNLRSLDEVFALLG